MARQHGLQHSTGPHKSSPNKRDGYTEPKRDTHIPYDHSLGLIVWEYLVFLGYGACGPQSDRGQDKIAKQATGKRLSGQWSASFWPSRLASSAATRISHENHIVSKGQTLFNANYDEFLFYNVYATWPVSLYLNKVNTNYLVLQSVGLPSGNLIH